MVVVGCPTIEGGCIWALQVWPSHCSNKVKWMEWVKSNRLVPSTYLPNKISLAKRVSFRGMNNFVCSLLLQRWHQNPMHITYHYYTVYLCNKHLMKYPNHQRNILKLGPQPTQPHLQHKQQQPLPTTPPLLLGKVPVAQAVHLHSENGSCPGQRDLQPEMRGP